jgi:hypothetical protein
MMSKRRRRRRRRRSSNPYISITDIRWALSTIAI